MPDVAAERFWPLAEVLVSAADVSRTLFDDSGRPLGERYFPPPFRGAAPFHMAVCPYPGPRRGRDMNVSALRPVIRHWDSVLRALVTLRAQHLGWRADTALTWIDLWFLGRIATAVPAYLARVGGGDAARTPVPTPVAALFKPTIGLYMIAERAFLCGADPDAPLTTATVVDALHRTRALLSDDAACSGPPRLLAQLIDVAVSGSSGTGTAPPGSDALGGAAPASLVRYGAAAARLELAKFAYFIDVEHRLARLSAAGLLGPYRGPRHLRGVPAAAWDLETVARRLWPVARGLAVPAPAGTAPTRRTERLHCEAARDRRWLDLFCTLQAEVLAALEFDAPVTLAMEDLGRIGAYLAYDWSYGPAQHRFLVHRRLLEVQ
jgi:hypothetical protein